eukprot:396096-Pleurochrysis_carterae.AAC.1
MAATAATSPHAPPTTATRRTRLPHPLEKTVRPAARPRSLCPCLGGAATLASSPATRRAGL